jgi:hypothetical protein
MPEEECKDPKAQRHELRAKKRLDKKFFSNLSYPKVLKLEDDDRSSSADSRKYKQG